MLAMVCVLCEMVMMMINTLLILLSSSSKILRSGRRGLHVRHGGISHDEDNYSFLSALLLRSSREVAETVGRCGCYRLAAILLMI